MTLRIEEAGHRVTIATPVGVTARALTLPLVLLLLFAVAAAYFEVWLRSVGSVESPLVGRVLLGACCASCAASLAMVLYVVWGVERLVADGQTLTVRHELFGVGRSLSFALADVPDLSFESSEGGEDGAVVLFAGSRRFRFGAGLTTLEHMRLKVALQDHLNRMRPRLR